MCPATSIFDIYAAAGRHRQNSAMANHAALEAIASHINADASSIVGVTVGSTAYALSNKAPGAVSAVARVRYVNSCPHVTITYTCDAPTCAETADKISRVVACAADGMSKSVVALG